MFISAVLLQVTQWHHPRFFAYFPASNSYVATTADILCDGIGCIGFSWVTADNILLAVCMLFKRFSTWCESQSEWQC